MIPEGLPKVSGSNVPSVSTEAAPAKKDAKKGKNIPVPPSKAEGEEAVSLAPGQGHTVTPKSITSPLGSKSKIPSMPHPINPEILEKFDTQGPKSLLLPLPGSKEVARMEEAMVETKPRPPKPLPQPPLKKAVSEVKQEKITISEPEAKTRLESLVTEVEKVVYSEQRDAHKILLMEKLAVLSNLYLSPEEWVDVLQAILQAISPSETKKIEAFWQFLGYIMEKPYLHNAFRDSAIRPKLERLLEEAVQWNTSRYFPWGVEILNVLHEEPIKDTVQMKTAFVSFNDVVSTKTIGKRKWAAAVDLAAEEFKGLFIHECEGLSVKDVYTYLEAKDKNHPSLNDNKFAKLSRLSVALMNNILHAFLDCGPKQMDRYISFFVDVAAKSVEKNDFATAYAIYLALNKVDSKMKGLKCADTYESLKTLFKEDKNYTNLRKAMGSGEKPMSIPAPILSKDIFEIKENMSLWTKKEGKPPFINPQILEVLFAQQKLIDAMPPLSQPLASNMIDLLKQEIPGEILDIITYTVINPARFTKDASAAAKKILHHIGLLGIGKDNRELLNTIDKELELLSKLCAHWSPYGDDQKEFLMFNFAKCAYLLDQLRAAEKSKEKRPLEAIKAMIPVFLDENLVQKQL